MNLPARLRRGLVRLLSATASAVLVSTALMAAPAQAAYGPPINVDLQLRSYTSTGVEFLVGRVVGTVQFDDGNSHYRLSLTMCRQSSYVNPHVQTLINGGVHQAFSPDGLRRPEICGGHGMAGAINGDFAYGGTIPALVVRIDGIHFDGATAKEIVRSVTLDNPYN